MGEDKLAYDDLRLMGLAQLLHAEWVGLHTSWNPVETKLTERSCALGTVSFPAHLNEDLLDWKTVVSALDPAFQNLKKIMLYWAYYYQKCSLDFNENNWTIAHCSFRLDLNALRLQCDQIHFPAPLRVYKSYVCFFLKNKFHLKACCWFLLSWLRLVEADQHLGSPLILWPLLQLASDMWEYMVPCLWTTKWRH